MNKRIFFVVLLSLVALVSAQTAPKLSSPAPMEHRGFYNSVSFGAAYNWYENSKNEKDEYYSGRTNVVNREINTFEYSGGTFPMIEFKFGVALANLLAFHTVFNMGFFSGTIEEGFSEYRKECGENKICIEEELEKKRVRDKSSDAYSFRSYIGFGTTIYPIQDKQSIMNGLFVGGSVGYTLFATMINDGLENASANAGAAFQVELGKDWWVNDHLSIGVGLGYARSGLVWNTVKSYDTDNVISLSFRLTRG
ncbi:hypothetical protein [Fibrobacter sp.]|uniref:hypothetical protein n=2 Tax=Fibrobacter TaxID=832 RepID=UPI0025C67A21|nr:hypothetical protein [Fibrobacter sp.]MCI6437940.1 hypothetical protein [Fibrobacter sp.]MDD7498928.1 hypothetical protein [Fibrobacter sp.]MDY5725009.1 hypothetical protein [Fibrobacter sp.]